MHHYAKMGLAQRRRASLWHGGQDTALYAVSCDLMLGLPYFKQAAEELTQALAEAPQELEPEDKALLDEVQGTIAVLSGYCWVGCLKRRPWDVDEDRPTTTCRTCGERLPWCSEDYYYEEEN